MNQSQEFYKNIFTSASIGIVVCDESGQCVEANEAMGKIIGGTREDILSQNYHHMKSWEGTDILKTILRAKETKKKQQLEENLTTSLGRRVSFEFNIIPFAEKKQNYLLIIIHDITRRKQAEESLKQEHFLLQSVMNGAKNSHLVYLDRDFNFVRVNETYATTCGFSPEEMIGKNHFALYPHDENEAIFARVRDTGEPFEVHDKPFEFIDQPERGVTYWDWTLTPAKDETGQTNGLIFSLFETTKRKQAELALQKMKNELEKRVEERTAELEQKKLHLEETNIALKVLLQQMKENKNEVERNVYNNLEKLVFPYLEKLKQETSGYNGNYCLDILESNLQNITELFSPGLSEQILKLTPSELKIANLIKHGKTTKEIAEFLNLSIRTINFHRENIRNKLDLKNKKVNLRSHLLAIV